MNRSKVILGALLLCAFAAAIFYVTNLRKPEIEPGYVEIGNNKLSTYYFSVNSLEKQNHDGIECIVGTVKGIYNKPQKLPPIDGKSPSYTMELWAANPKAKQTIHLSVSVYDKDHNLLRSYPFPSDSDTWTDCLPNSVGEMCWEAIMDAYNKSDK